VIAHLYNKRYLFCSCGFPEYNTIFPIKGGSDRLCHSAIDSLLETALRWGNLCCGCTSDIIYFWFLVLLMFFVLCFFTGLVSRWFFATRIVLPSVLFLSGWGEHFYVSVVLFTDLLSCIALQVDLNTVLFLSGWVILLYSVSGVLTTNSTFYNYKNFCRFLNWRYTEGWC